MSHTSKNASQNHIELTHQESHCEFKNTPLKPQSRNQEAAGKRLSIKTHVVGLPPKERGGLAVGQPKTNNSLVVKNIINIS